MSADRGPLSGYTDWHSHILPGVDDGVKELDASLAILATYGDMGFRRVWLTPHIMEDMPNEPDDLRRRFEELRAAYNGPIELRLGAENMLDNLFEERLESRNLLAMGENADHLLVETSYFNPPQDMDGILERILAAGYYPILAHPERYMYMDERDYKRLHGMGVQMQLNITALAGAYGPVAEKKAAWLLHENLYDYSGTDIHRHRSVAHLHRPCLRGKMLDKLAQIGR